MPRMELRDALENAFDEIRPSVQADGGDIEFIGVENGIVSVKMQGACKDCPGRDMTLSMTVEPMLKERVPGIRAVIAI